MAGFLHYFSIFACRSPWHLVLALDVAFLLAAWVANVSLPLHFTCMARDSIFLWVSFSFTLLFFWGYMLVLSSPSSTLSALVWIFSVAGLFFTAFLLLSRILLIRSFAFSFDCLFWSADILFRYSFDLCRYSLQWSLYCSTCYIYVLYTVSYVGHEQPIRG